MRTYLVLFLSLILTVGTTFAQEPHRKFGKPLMEELKMETYPIDTAASAVILVDYGESRFFYDKTQGSFTLQFNRYTRVKIFDPEGYDQADVSIALYHSGGSKETVSNVKGNTYNLVDGKITTTKLDKKSRFREEYSTNWDLEKFTLPNVKEGAVIEYQYTLTSDFYFHLQDWQFQHSIPVVWSEYNAVIPEYFDYKQLSQGYVPMAIKDHSTANGMINFTTNSGGQISSSQVNFVNHEYRWVARDVPAFKEEKYLTSVNDHISKVEFELATIQYPNSPTKQIMDTWTTLDKKLKQSESFGLALRRSGYYKDQLEVIKASSSGQLETMQKIYAFVQNRMEWNGSKKMMSSGLKKAFDERKGNSADINLLLVSMLRSADISADPVILSTRDHGKVLEYYPIISKFNYVIAGVTIDDKLYLLDATDSYCAVGTLPYRCLNKRGRMISDNSTWVDLIRDNRLVNMTQVKMKLTDEGSFEGTYTEQTKGYTAATRRKLITSKGKDEYVTDRFKDMTGWNINSFTFDNLESKDAPLVSTYEVALSETAEALGDLIYFNPVFSETFKENPFKTETRFYPVDYGSQTAHTYIANIEIPEGYVIDEMPENTALALPNRAGVFRYSVTKNGSTIQLVSSISIQQTEFNSEEYPGLREFYNKIVDTHNQQIVLKKI